MAERIRRDSMEHLELYDLDQITILKSNKQIPPPLPPPREQQHHLPPNFAFERYQFLCDMTRIKTDPIYAATPMFTTIPQTSQERPHRQLIGSYIRLENVRSLSPKEPISPEPKTAKIVENIKEENENGNNPNDDGQKDKNDDDHHHHHEFGSSSSSDEQENHGDNDERGVVEQIFNRHKKESTETN